MSELFAKLPLSVLSRRDLQPSDKLTFAAINFYQGANADAWPGIRTIATKTGLSSPTVIESIKRLEAVGLLIVQRMGIGKGNHYQVVSDKAALPVKPLDQSSHLIGSVQASLPEAFKPLKRIREDHRKDQEESVSPSAGNSNIDQPDQAPAEENSASTEAFSFVLKNGEYWALPEGKISEWGQSYPAIDIIAAVRKAAQWLLDNPSRRKTAAGMTRFLGNWLSNAKPNQKKPVVAGEPDWTPNAEERETILEMARRSGWPEPVFEGATV